MAEIIKTITLTNNGKSPPDGFCVEFVTKFSKQVGPLLLEMFNESLQQGTLRRTHRQAAISLIHKKRKDLDKCSSYSPVSLLNVDVKILAKVLACRLEPVLPSFTSIDQTGFIKNCHSFTNVRRLLNIIFSPHSTTAPEGVISFDAKNALNCMEWKYLFFSLHKFGFGECFIAWVRLLYTSPQARLCTNAIRSTLFPLMQGTRKGCPLSSSFSPQLLSLCLLRLRPSDSSQALGEEGQSIKCYCTQMTCYFMF